MAQLPSNDARRDQRGCQVTPPGWDAARRAVGDVALPDEPRTLPRHRLRAIAVSLRSRSGWSYGQIAQALSVPKTTIYRWIEGDPTPSMEVATDSNGSPWIAVVAIGLFLLSLLGAKQRPPRNPRLR